MRPRLADLLAFLVLLALALACFSRLVARPGALIVDPEKPSLDYAMAEDPRGIGNDLTFLFLPHYLTITSQIEKTGRPSFWDASGFAGRPMIGNPQGGLLYPPVWVAWACRSPAALGWLTVGHLLWGALGAYLLARGLGTGRLAATVAAGCFEASPFILAHTFEGHYPHVWAAAWYPWAFWAFVAHRRGALRGTFALPLILGMVFLTGHPQEWYYLVFALSAWVVIDAVRSLWMRRPRESAVKLGVWAAVIGLSFGLVALELVPDAAAQEGTLRSGKLTLGQASRYAPHSENVFQFLHPFALGGPAEYVGRHNFWEEQLGFGLVPLALIVIAATRHPNRLLVSSWLAFTVVTTVFACGRRMILFVLLFQIVPGMNRFRVPSRALFLTNVGVAVLAALGIEALRRRAEAPGTWLSWDCQFRRGLALLVGCLLVGQFCAWRYDAFETDRPKAKKEKVPASEKVAGGRNNLALIPKKAEKEAKSTALVNEFEPHRGLTAVSRIVGDVRFWLLLGGMAAAISYGGRRGDGRVAAWGFGALVLIELGMYGHELIKVAPPETFLRFDPISDSLARAKPLVDGPFRIRARDLYYDDLRAASHGFEKININDWYQLQRSADLYQTLYPLLEQIPPVRAGDPMGNALRDFGADIRQEVLDRLCVAFLVSDHVDSDEPWPIEATGNWQGKRFAIHRNPTVLPRAYVVPRSYPARDDAPRELGLFRRINPREAVLMQEEPLAAVGPRQKFTPAEWVQTDSDHLVVRVTTQAPGLLVIADTWAAGWTARLDGEPAPVLRGNHAQRVVSLPLAGRHELVMTYKPPGLILGAVVSAFSALVWLAALLVLKRRRKIRPDPLLQGNHRHYETHRYSMVANAA